MQEKRSGGLVPSGSESVTSIYLEVRGPGMGQCDFERCGILDYFSRRQLYHKESKREASFLIFVATGIFLPVSGKKGNNYIVECTLNCTQYGKATEATGTPRRETAK